MAQCVLCHTANSIGSTYAMKKGLVLFFCAFLFLGSASAITISTYGPVLNNEGMPIVWIAGYVMGAGLVGRGIAYLTMPIAVIIAYRQRDDSWVLGPIDTVDFDS